MIRFSLVGGFGSIADMGTLAILYHGLHVLLSIATALAFEAAIITNFFAHAHITFRTGRHRLGRRFVTFQLMSLVALSVVWSVVNGLAYLFGTKPFWVVYVWNALALGSGFIVNYTLNVSTTWRDAVSAPPDRAKL